MPLFRRQDALLVAGFTAAVVVIFAAPISQMLDYAREVEREKGRPRPRPRPAHRSRTLSASASRSRERTAARFGNKQPPVCAIVPTTEGATALARRPML
jgi:hypothetical protein